MSRRLVSSTYAPGKFVVATFNGLVGNAFQENT